MYLRPNFKLDRDDIDAIQKLYGPPKVNFLCYSKDISTAYHQVSLSPDANEHKKLAGCGHSLPLSLSLTVSLISHSLSSHQWCGGGVGTCDIAGNKYLEVGGCGVGVGVSYIILTRSTMRIKTHSNQHPCEERSLLLPWLVGCAGHIKLQNLILKPFPQ